MDAAHKPVILTYHSIAEGPSPLEISSQIFAAQMQWLKSNSQVVPLREIVDSLKERKTMPERAVVLTFDDGFLDFHAAAAPVLLRLGLPATVFLPTAFMGKTNAWAGQPAWVKPQPLMAWSHVRELAKQGIEFGSHSVTHPDLTKVSQAELAAELEKSKAEIQTQTGQHADYFCYPYGRWNKSVRTPTARCYRGACSTGAGVVERDADPFGLPRVDAHYVRKPKWFEAMFTRRFENYVGMRRMIRLLRGQPEGVYSRI
jgi:peptidoglycan/xylan/chitin deacetylase (PgdA/CDA1 family)